MEYMQTHPPDFPALIAFISSFYFFSQDLLFLCVKKPENLFILSIFCVFTSLPSLPSHAIAQLTCTFGMNFNSSIRLFDCSTQFMDKRFTERLMHHMDTIHQPIVADHSTGSSER
jgi:hypothetical protein